MQVSHANDHVTHAVIGGSSTVEFGISSSAEFFHILSSTLYSDQILAVVREVLCNAWDAHIAAQRTNIPVEVTFTDDAMIVKDHGLGIPHADMGAVYGTYGNSTKKNDGKQTGGFGLGCKAPFAYTDHFEVVSSNQGTRTIYAMSKSSGQTMGKPGITPIVSFPTDESGLQVTVPIKNNADRNRFFELVRIIAHNGDMNVTLNGNKIDTLGFPDNQNFLVLLSREKLMYKARIQVRYGNVIYPVEINDKLNHYYEQIVAILNKASPNSHSPCYLILQAPPDSIAVTPSREALSMQEHTINTVLELFFSFLHTVNPALKTEFKSVIDTLTTKAVQEKQYNDLLDRQERLPTNPTLITIDKGKPMVAVGEIAKAMLIKKYPDEWAFRQKDLIQRVQKMRDAKLIDSHAAYTFLEAVKAEKVAAGNAEYNARNTWFYKNVTGPAIKRMMKDTSGLMELKNLCVLDKDVVIKPGHHRSWYAAEVISQPATKTRLNHAAMGLPYLRKILIISPSKTDFLGRARCHEVIKKFGGTAYGCLVYFVGRKKGADEAARKCFANAGYQIVDLTVRYDWDAPVVKREDKPVKKPRLKGWPLVTGAIFDRTDQVNLQQAATDGAARSEKPEYFVETKTSMYCPTTAIWPLGRYESYHFAKLFGHLGVVTFTASQTQKAKEAGAIPVDKWLAAKLPNMIRTNPRIMEYMEHSIDSVDEAASQLNSSMVYLIWGNEDVRKKFGLVNNMTAEDKMLWEIWKKFNSTYHQALYPEVDKLSKELAAIKLHAKNITLIKKLESNPFIELIDAHGLSHKIREVPANDLSAKTRLIDLLYKTVNS